VRCHSKGRISSSVCCGTTPPFTGLLASAPSAKDLHQGLDTQVTYLKPSFRLHPAFRSCDALPMSAVKPQSCLEAPLVHLAATTSEPHGATRCGNHSISFYKVSHASAVNAACSTTCDNKPQGDPCCVCICTATACYQTHKASGPSGKRHGAMRRLLTCCGS
jgi:hypothetical protein